MAKLEHFLVWYWLAILRTLYRLWHCSQMGLTLLQRHFLVFGTLRYFALIQSKRIGLIIHWAAV